MIPVNSGFLSSVSRAEQPVSSLIEEQQKTAQVTEKVIEAAQGILTNAQPASFSSPRLLPANAGPLKENFGERSPAQLPKPLAIAAPVPAPPKTVDDKEEVDMFSFSTPPRTKKPEVSKYLSPITPSRVFIVEKGRTKRTRPPEPPSNKHYVETFVTASKEASSSLNKKKDHTFIFDSPDRRTQKILGDAAVGRYIQGCRDILANDEKSKLPVLQFTPSVEITVPAVDKVQIKRGDEKIAFKIHGKTGEEALFPVEGDRTMTLSESKGAPPRLAIEAVQDGKRRRLNGEKIKLTQHFKESLAKLISQAPSSSSSSSSTT